MKKKKSICICQMRCLEKLMRTLYIIHLSNYNYSIYFYQIAQKRVYAIPMDINGLICWTIINFRRLNLFLVRIIHHSDVQIRYLCIWYYNFDPQISLHRYIKIEVIIQVFLTNLFIFNNMITKQSSYWFLLVLKEHIVLL